MKPSINDGKMLTKSDLKSKRGWTEKLIRDFLGAPDKTKPNYQFRSTMQLFDVSRVENVESTPEFKSAMNVTRGRQSSAKKSVETKLKKLREWVNKITIEIPILEKSELISEACDSYNRFREGRFDDWEDAHTNTDPLFLSRICVNYIRHELTEYERQLDEMSGKVGFSEGYAELRRKIFSEISKTYPWLAEECERQRKRKEELDAFRDSNKR